MRKFFSLILIFSVIALTSCNTPTKQNTTTTQTNNAPQTMSTPTAQNKLPNIQPLDKGVVLNITIETDGARKPKVSGETNLPNGTELMVSIDGKSVNYMGGEKASVQDGRFVSTAFTLHNNNLEAGQYTAEVVMPIPSTQSDAVRAVIGEQGEKLKGSLVHKKGYSVTVSVEQPFQLNADGTVSLTVNQQEIVAVEKEAWNLFNELKRLEQQGRDMEVLRKKDNADNLKKCGELMRERQPIADDLRAKVEALPHPFSIALTPAAISVKLCVSCASFAMDNCNQTKKYLLEAEKEMQRK